MTGISRSGVAAVAPADVEAQTTSTAVQRAPAPDGLPQWLAMGGMATVGMTALRVAGWTLSDLFFLAASMVILLRLLTGRARTLAPVVTRRSSPGILIGLLLFSAGALLASLGRSLDVAGSALALARVSYITIVWFWTVRSVASSERTYRRLLLAAVVGAVVHALIGIGQDVTGANAGAPGWGRSTGLSDHFGDLGISVGSMIPVLALWRRESRGRSIWDPLRVVGLLILLGGVASSGSMSPLGATIVGMCVAAIVPRLALPGLRRRRRVAAPAIIAFAVIGLLASGSLDLSVQTRFSELTSGDSAVSASAESRSVQAEIATAEIVRSPVVGVGLDPTSNMVSHDGESHQVHNFYIRVLYEAGIFGLLGLMLILALISRQVWQLVRVLRNTSLSWVPAALVGSFSMVLVSAFFGPVLYGRISWLPMALINALYGLARGSRLGPPVPQGGVATAP